MFARAFTVFNVAQVDGYEPEPIAMLPENERFRPCRREDVTDNGQAVKFVSNLIFPGIDLDFSSGCLPMISLTCSVYEIWEFIGHWAKGPQ
jgi:hypothetical protein